MSKDIIQQPIKDELEKQEEVSKNDKYRTYQFLINKNHPLYSYLTDMMHKANNLYNATNFHSRQLYTGLTIEEGKTPHPLQQEVIDLFYNTIPIINKHNTEKFQRLIKEDLEKNKKFDKTKKRKVTMFKMPTRENPFCSYELMDAVFKTSGNQDYNALPAQVNQLVMKQVYNDWDSYFALKEMYNENPNSLKGRPNPPKYKEKGGVTELTFSNQVCKVKDGRYIRFPKTKAKFDLSKHLLEKIDNNKFVQVRVQKFYNTLKLEVVLDCKKTIKDLKPKSEIKNVMSLDLGVNNLVAAVSNNGMQPIIINGKAIKSINQHYNKLRAKCYSDLRIGKNPKEGVFTSKRLEYIDKKRNLKIKDFLHKASCQIVKIALENDIDKVIAGYNPTWKTNVEMRKKDKQNFTNIPFSTFLSMLKYKLKAEGIHFETFEESYTSQASFLDSDPIPTYGDKNIPKFSGERFRRGLYISKNGIAINADVNGACNILRKHYDKDVVIDYKILSNVKKINIRNGYKNPKSTLRKLLDDNELRLA